MVQHVYPNLPVGKDFRRKCLLQNLPGGRRLQTQYRFLRDNPSRFPGQFETILKALYHPLLFQLVQTGRTLSMASRKST